VISQPNNAFQVVVTHSVRESFAQVRTDREPPLDLDREGSKRDCWCGV